MSSEQGGASRLILTSMRKRDVCCRRSVACVATETSTFCSYGLCLTTVAKPHEHNHYYKTLPTTKDGPYYVLVVATALLVDYGRGIV